MGFQAVGMSASDSCTFSLAIFLLLACFAQFWSDSFCFILSYFISLLPLRRLVSKERQKGKKRELERAEGEENCNQDLLCEKSNLFLIKGGAFIMVSFPFHWKAFLSSFPRKCIPGSIFSLSSWLDHFNKFVINSVFDKLFIFILFFSKEQSRAFA